MDLDQRRLELQNILSQILLSLGIYNTLEDASHHVYFQPPESIKLNYPCIIYERSRIDSRFANNRPYSIDGGYSITIIDRNPDSKIPNSVANLPMCRFDRSFSTDNLYHNVFTIY